MADGDLEDLDALYAAKLADFTQLRTTLAAEAKKRGDAETAKQISAARKPTSAAHTVNVLVLTDPAVRRRLTDLGERLRAAHAGMDGGLIRELTAQQRRLIDELARAAFKAAAVTSPTATLREDVTATLQAAIADPEVAARLGRLTKAEQWSGFGEFGDTAIVFKPTRARKTKPEAEAEKPPPGKESGDDRGAEERRRQQQARAALAAAERARADADDAVKELQSDLATARLRRDDARRRLKDAESALTAAEDAYEQAKQSARDAAAVVKEAKAGLKRGS
ncbi:hypothetical protein AB4Z42_13555 [Mycobacterium sp. 2YAF39]|uniref:hypothetical protein n=1 Tax=Mycobacterium sp. 2YAF39 TaxID=3233033 RepID=UPI003F9C5DC1